ncbi:hypothetical protein [Frigoribacterium endophyticum]|uniref:hypothetical protein n=1 Tax=Frigoribacterium endophyticum TaxID=1522176 RepID=UPI00141D8811|nr:hypothetical protein [Frigoribacterium endophyticum]
MREKTMERHAVIIAGATFILAQGADIADIRAAVVQAARSGGDLVDLVVYGNEKVSALVTPGVPVLFRSQIVDAEDRDTGDTALPFTDFDSYEAAFPLF